MNKDRLLGFPLSLCSHVGIFDEGTGKYLCGREGVPVLFCGADPEKTDRTWCEFRNCVFMHTRAIAIPGGDQL